MEVKSASAVAFNGCRFCHGRGCLACAKESERAERDRAWAGPAHRDDGSRGAEPVKKPRYTVIKSFGTVCSCNRCGCPLRIADKRLADAEILRLSETTKGVCASCAITEFLYNTYPANMIIDERGPEMLLNPLVGEAFIKSGLMERADMDINEVDWQRVVDNWNLPVKIAKSPLNPYRMGDAKRGREAREQFQRAQSEGVEGIKRALSETFGGDFEVEDRGGSIVARKKVQ